MTCIDQLRRTCAGIGLPGLAALFIALCIALMPAVASARSAGTQSAPNKPRQIRIVYEKPKNPAHQALYEELRTLRALERLQQLLGPIRLPRPLLLKLTGCDGEANAWYEDNEITVCYEFLDEVHKNAPDKTLPEGITRQDALLGPSLDVFLHEMGHAVFDILKIPVFGREEDAADIFSAYIMLQFDREHARRLLLGTAYQYKADLLHMQPPLALKDFSDVHGLPAQRFFNVLCIAYGADKILFADVVEKKFLPKERAEDCEDEYKQAARAFNMLILPHIDQKLARRVLKTWMREVDAALR